MPFGKKKKEPAEPKEPKEKKPKKPKKPKKEKPPKPKKEKKAKDPNKKKSPVKILIPLALVAVAAAAFFLLKPKETEEEPKAPELPGEYNVGDLVVTGLSVGEEETEVQAVRAKTVVYTYTDLKDAAAAASKYVGQLTGETPRFSVVDEAFVRTERPDFSAPEGTVLLARNIEKEAEPEDAQAAPDSSQADSSQADSSQAGARQETEEVNMVLTVKIDWSPGVCVVTADEAEGTVTSPPPPENGMGGGQSIGLHEAQDRLENMEPAQLGLSGTSMDEYEVFPLDGVAMVDGQPCIRVNVYSSRNAQNSNEFMGSFLMSMNEGTLYRLDPVTGEVSEVELSD